MGLDIVEIVMGLEQAFGIEIANEAAEQMRTPRIIVEFLAKKLNAVDDPPSYCLSARAFHRFRQSCLAVSSIPRRAISPDAQLSQLFPGSKGNTLWKSVGQHMGSVEFPSMPYGLGWLNRVKRIRDLIDWLVTEHTHSLMTPGKSWSRSHIRTVVRAIIARVIGRNDFPDDADFVHDLRLD
jgi:hypothetical protein